MKINLRLIMVLSIFLLITACKGEELYDINGPQVVVGYHELDTVNYGSGAMGSDPIYVDSRGITISDAVTKNAVGCWINVELEQGGAQRTFKSFNKIEDLFDFKIKKRGIYYIYPQVKPGASYAEIEITYTVP